MQSRQEVQQRLKDLITLESELVNRDIQISSLNGQLSSAKVEAAAERAAAEARAEEAGRELEGEKAAAGELREKIEVKKKLYDCSRIGIRSCFVF